MGYWYIFYNILAGQERFRSNIPANLFQKANGIFLIVDVCSPNVEETVDTWIKNILQNVSLSTKLNGRQGRATLYLIGNKIDIVESTFMQDKNYERIIERQKLEDIAKRYGIDYFETSCKYNINVTNLLYRITVECYNKLPRDRKSTINIEIHKSAPEKKGCCGKKTKEIKKNII